MRYRLPEDCAGVTLAGVSLTATDGFVEADAAAASELATHGIVPADAAPAEADEKAKSKRARS